MPRSEFGSLSAFLCVKYVLLQQLDVDVAFGVCFDVNEQRVEAVDCAVDVVVELWVVHQQAKC
jgi:hypothetical protein